MNTLRAAALTLALFAGTAHAGGWNAGDQWTGPDKDKHAIIGAVTGFAVTSATGSVWYGVGAALLVGVAKEYADSRNPTTHTASYKDALVTGLGGAVGAGFGHLVLTYGKGRTTVQYATEF